jgi:hypothetical protein
MKLGIRCIMVESGGAFKVCIAEYPYPIFWLPKFSIDHPEQHHAGDRDTAIRVDGNMVREKLDELRTGKEPEFSRPRKWKKKPSKPSLFA